MNNRPALEDLLRMLYHVYNPTVYFPLWWFFWIVWMFLRRDSEWIIKDQSDEVVLYSSRYLSRAGSDIKHLYRSTPKANDRIATIQPISPNVWLITRSAKESGWFFQTPCFQYAGTEYCWSGRSKLTDTAGTTILELKTGSWWYTKVGDLTMVGMEEDMREVVLATLVAMDWSVTISIAQEVQRLEQCRRVCEEERNRGNGLKVQEK
jgi:hypothetical protein